MSRSFSSYFAAVAIVLASALAGPGAAIAQNTVYPSEDTAESVFLDVIERTLDAAADEIRRGRWGDPDDSSGDYEAWPTDEDLETQRKLDRLYARHDRTIAKLEKQLDRRLRKAEKNFAHGPRRGHGPWKADKRRARYEARIDSAYAAFEDQVDQENRRFAARRDRILSRQYMG